MANVAMQLNNRKSMMDDRRSLRPWNTLFRPRFLVAGGMLVCLAPLVPPAWSQQDSTDLTSQTIEYLMNIEVTSVSKTEQTLSRTASAVFVISPEDIRRSGATNIPDLFRMVPGMNVSQINDSTWAISARGFNSRFSNELLVLVGGRAV